MNKDIIFLNPVCTHNIWGGTRLNREFGYPIEGDDIGECWGISAHPNGDGTVASGAYKGMKLSELWEMRRTISAFRYIRMMRMRRFMRTDPWVRPSAGSSWIARRMLRW